MASLAMGCAPSVTYRYRLTVEVDTPQGLRTGASVIETMTKDATKTGWLPESRLITSRVRGEAVFVDLGDGRNVIAIMARGPHGSEGTEFDWLVPSVLRIPLPREAEKLPRSGVFEVPQHLMPTLVTFSDLNDPKTARVVAPGEFPTVFGPGFRFKSARIEMTRAEVTRGIERKLPLLETHRVWMSNLLTYPNQFTPHYHLFVRG